MISSCPWSSSRKPARFEEAPRGHNHVVATKTIDRLQQEPFDTEIARALETPGLASVLEAHPERRDALLDGARSLAVAAFEE